jgi:hypothetical protein
MNKNLALKRYLKKEIKAIILNEGPIARMAKKAAVGSGLMAAGALATALAGGASGALSLGPTPEMRAARQQQRQADRQERTRRQASEPGPLVTAWRQGRAARRAARGLPAEASEQPTQDLTPQINTAIENINIKLNELRGLSANTNQTGSEQLNRNFITKLDEITQQFEALKNLEMQRAQTDRDNSISLGREIIDSIKESNSFNDQSLRSKIAVKIRLINAAIEAMSN